MSLSILSTEKRLKIRLINLLIIKDLMIFSIHSSKISFCRFCLFIILIISTLACNSNKSYHQVVKFPQQLWLKSKTIQFEVPIEKNHQMNDLGISLRYLTHLHHQQINFQLVIKSPSGEVIQKNIKAYIRDKKGNSLGKAIGDMTDIEQVVFSNFEFKEQGKYLVKINHRLPNDSLWGIVDAGFILFKAKQ